MKYLIIELRAQTATFRNPDFQNFHKSLPLPPPTTLMGIAGAALGLSPKATQFYFEEDAFQMGVYGITNGKTKDLWKYRTLDEKKPSSIIKKEILFDNKFFLIYGSDNTEKIHQIQNAFSNPVYALTLGNSDSLVKVSSDISLSEEVEKSNEVAHCLVEGDIIKQVTEQAALSPFFSIYTTAEPITYNLPIRFEYTSDYGFRRVIGRKKLSFIGEPMQLNFLQTGIRYKDHFIPVFTL